MVALRVAVDSSVSKWGLVMSGIPQGLVLFGILVGYTDRGPECIHSKLADDNKLRGATDTLEERNTSQRNLDRLER